MVIWGKTKEQAKIDAYNRAAQHQANISVPYPPYPPAISGSGGNGSISTSFIPQPLYKNISNREIICKWVLEFGYEPVAISTLLSFDNSFMYIDQELVIYKERNQTLQLNEEKVKRFNENV